MKTLTILLVLSVLVLADTAGVKAQSSNYKNVTQNSIETLKHGIKSENLGVRRSSIYMAGLYKINEVVDVLVEQLQKEKDPSTRVLIALSLYNIGNPKGMEAVRDISQIDPNTRVKRMSTALYGTYIENVSQK
jgi:HEAT repeat protein